MQIDLTPEEAQPLLVSLEYSVQRRRDAKDTPPPVRQENVTRLRRLETKLRERQRTAARR
jgi:hypothetical protein